MIEPNERKTLDALVARLAESYSTLSPQQVSDAVHTAYDHFTGRPLREFVPLFVERNAKRELNALRQAATA